MDAKIRLNGEIVWDGRFTDAEWLKTIRSISEVRDEKNIMNALKEGIECGWIDPPCGETGNKNHYSMEGMKTIIEIRKGNRKASGEMNKMLLTGAFFKFIEPNVKIWVGPKNLKPPFAFQPKPGESVSVMGNDYFTDQEWFEWTRSQPGSLSDKEIEELQQDAIEWGWLERVWNGKEFENRFTQLAAREFQRNQKNHGSAGSSEHNEMVMSAHKFYCIKGCAVNIIRQGGPEPLPDLEILSGDYLLEFSKGRKVNIEIENTSATKPARLLQNLAKGKNHGKMVAFITDDEDNAEKIVGILNKPYREFKDGKYEYYMKEPGEPFIPEKEFNEPISPSDFKVLILKEDGDIVEYAGALSSAPDVPRTMQQDSIPVGNQQNTAPAEDDKKITNLDALENYLAGTKGAHSLSELCEVFGMERNMACAMLCKLIDRGTVLKEDRGMYIHRKWVAFNAQG